MPLNLPPTTFDAVNVRITFRGQTLPAATLNFDIDPDPPQDVPGYGPWTATMSFRYIPRRRWKRGQKRTARDRRRARRQS